MPFKSDAQRKLCYVLKGKGQAGSWDCAEWSEATGDKKLPEHVEDEDASSNMMIAVIMVYLKLIFDMFLR